ncbi:unnamed protein product [Withania somnifera]
MGNCMGSSRAHVVVHHDEEAQSDEELAQKPKEQSIFNKRRKNIRFSVVDADDDEKKEGKGKEMMMKKGVVRIKVVVTQEELKQILNGQLDFSSRDEVLRRIKIASRGTSARSNNRRLLCEDGSFSYGKMKGSSTSWRPVLDSIPEDH